MEETSRVENRSIILGTELTVLVYGRNEPDRDGARTLGFASLLRWKKGWGMRCADERDREDTYLWRVVGHAHRACCGVEMSKDVSLHFH